MDTDNLPEPVVVRQGAALRTGDELLRLFIDDAVDLGVTLDDDTRECLAEIDVALEANRSPYGTSHLDVDDSETLEYMVHRVEAALSELGYYVEREDGYVIYQEDPSDGE